MIEFRICSFKKNVDVIFLQETILTNNDLSMLNLIDKIYYVISVAPFFLKEV